MPDKKIIDSEIVKELKRYSDVSDSDITITCFKTRLLKEIYLFINRLQAKVNLLEGINKQLYSTVDFVKMLDIAELKAENKKLKRKIKDFKPDFTNLFKNITIEDLKEIKLIWNLKDLHQRLVLSYNDNIPFEQFEEDRLVVSNAIDKIEYLQAENERLKAEVGKEFTCFVGDPHKVEHCPYLEELQTAKAEAYRECIEKIQQIDVSMSDGYIIIKKNKFDNLLNELVGDK